MKVRHIKRRNGPVYIWRLAEDVAWEPGPEWKRLPSGALCLEGVDLSRCLRMVPRLTLERVRKTW